MSEVILDDKLKQPEFKGMVDHGAIGVFDNFVKWEFCDSVVDSFEYWYKRKHIEKEDLDVNVTTFSGRDIKLNPMSEGGKQFTQGSLGRKDDQLYLEISDPAMAMEINQIVGGCFELYAKKYKELILVEDIMFGTLRMEVFYIEIEF